MTAGITGLSTRRIELPLPRPWGPDVPSVTVIEVTVERSDGALGTGFSWTPSIGAASVEAMLEHDIRGFAIGRTAQATELWPLLWRHLHEAGGGGVTTIAMAGLDLALWDAEARQRDLPVADLIGRRRDSVELYGSGVNLHYPLDELRAQAQRWVDRGFTAVKMKVGSPELADDLERVGAVRDIIGPDRALMIDANQRWDLEHASTALAELERFDLAWIEEPLRADDLRGYVALKQRTAIPIACGENLYTAYRFGEFIDAGAVDIIQPNAVRVGGITPFLRIAALGEAAGIRVAPHLLLELSGQLALTLRDETMVEDVESAGFVDLRALRPPHPVAVDGTTLTLTGQPGLGMTFEE